MLWSIFHCFFWFFGAYLFYFFIVFQGILLPYFEHICRALLTNINNFYKIIIQCLSKKKIHCCYHFSFRNIYKKRKPNRDTKCIDFRTILYRLIFHRLVSSQLVFDRHSCESVRKNRLFKYQKFHIRFIFTFSVFV